MMGSLTGTQENRNTSMNWGHDFTMAAGFFTSLSCSTRLSIIQLLSGGPLFVNEIAEHLDCSQPLISQHLKILRTAGIVGSTRKGRKIVYHISNPLALDIVQRVTMQAESSR
ncbi:metalloregulator ArsR/SmtB family transcription factor [Corynebacterium sp. ES2794-CONJ1]|uniref:ArsR/SmtB family transcription factor n=1 Tax=unclassified Corynebacterium TaxID=2624378 RepID=UPI00216700C3|nr:MULTISPECIES: metalloregulator ArsR/SmtB family transcription factor [unclassified Corynebacterium]MCS4490590.1 metalloregulator ArsR/SmtB family transcription factor [Corynebacterium sp. ES2775-CONJ]MCS4492369.1 metalloregulator ArsR/SmtB family transcription factor [Corynebacterium sp. ES2715-CONJ3]MCS4532439.1 metalloregulator ArsR/SmtB family transcription factor [Corynebacterium sp. ES2730-CONJ]MCU9519834.1 metalloregulator ArsR/SmtB family transcription factor [Corynebacterium sp. ES27